MADGKPLKATRVTRRATGRQSDAAFIHAMDKKVRRDGQPLTDVERARLERILRENPRG